jgi:type IV secretion system protein VirD4
VRADGQHPLEWAAGIVLVGFLGLALLVELSGALGGFVSGHGWPFTPLDAMPDALSRLPGRLDDPKTAFPPDLRGRLPSAVVWYLALIALLAGATAISMRVAARLQPARAFGAGWARRRDLRRLRSPATRGRIVLGQMGRSTIATETQQSLLVVAPTQSGKTTALAVPAILEWDGPVVALSVKTDLLRDTLAHRSSIGDVVVFDPTGATTLRDSASWSPLARCGDWGGARRVAASLAAGAGSSRRSLADGDFWYSAAAKLLSPLLFAAATSGRTMADVVAWIDMQEEHAVVQALEEADSAEALQAMHANWMRDERQRSSIYTTAETILEAYADPRVLARSSRSDISAEALLDGGRHTVYLCGPAREQKRLRPVLVALIQELLDGAYAASSQRDGPLDPPLLIVLDEVANIAPLPDLDVLVSTAAGHGIQFVTVLQDLAQAYNRWGRDRADTIINNHRARLFGAGISDERTLDYLGRLLGHAEYQKRSITAEPGVRHSVTDTPTYLPLTPPPFLREGREGTALLVYGTLPPVRLSLRPWYADRRLRRLVL